ncbi:MAG: helix-turn-helix domain-containing protein [Hyphomicrobiaceae bacterium]
MATTSIGVRLREARKKQRLTQSKLAKTAGISVSYLNLIEHNKRTIGGALLNRLVRELGLDVSKLSGQEDARLVQQLSELSSERLFQDLMLSDKGAQLIVSRDPDWARAVIRLYNAWRSNIELVEALSDQLNRDPYVLETSHEILTKITSIRSFAEILHDHGDLSQEQRRRFTSLLAEESGNLSNTARSLFHFMSEREQENRSTAPAGEVDDFIIDHNNFFPDLEIEAKALFDRLQRRGRVDERALADELTEHHGLSLIFDDSEIQPSTQDRLTSHYQLDEDAKRLTIRASLPPVTLRFQLARVLFARCCRAQIELLLSDKVLTSDEARTRAFHALARYGAGAILLPYDPVLEDAEQLRYDVQVLMTRYNASFEQVCHRLVTLRRPGASAVPFAFMRTDPAGNTSKRFSLPDLRLPRHGSACPLWAIYRAFSSPDQITTQLIHLPDDRRFLMMARAIPKEARSYSSPSQSHSIMLACNANYADRVVYGDYFAALDPALATEAGISCRLCPRSHCEQRAYAQILPVPDQSKK